MCKLLSRWWTHNQTDNVLWRSSQSGGRATTRRKKGLSTEVHTNDICATDPIAFPLMKAFSIEVKRGYKGAVLSDLMDVSCTALTKQPYEEWLEQARNGMIMSKSLYWMLIHRRDKREATIVMPAAVFTPETIHPDTILKQHIEFLRMRWISRQTDEATPLIQLRLEDFLRCVTPDHVRALVEDHNA